MIDFISSKDFENLIFEFRGMKVMIDSDLAALYETETKKLKQQVKRNINRFPEDFMFELNREEKDSLIIRTPRLASLKHASVNPMVFTEQGVAMLSSVLTSQKAIAVNIGIMRAFSQYRSILLGNKELRQEIMDLDGKLNKAFKYLLSKIDALKDQKNKPLPQIGFKQQKKEKK